MLGYFWEWLERYFFANILAISLLCNIHKLDRKRSHLLNQSKMAATFGCCLRMVSITHSE